MIEIDQLSLSLKGHSILKNISAGINKGGFTAILGPNGAGKSTFLKCLTGSEKSFTGTVKLDGRELPDYSLKEMASKRAVLSQRFQVEFPFTVEEVVTMGRYDKDLGTSKKNQDQIFEEVLLSVDALHLRNRIFPSLSGGEQQRVQLARVLAQIWGEEERYLFLDEPTSALDLKHQVAVLKLVRQLCYDKGYTIIAVLHDLNLAKAVSDHVILLKKGELFASGSTNSLITPHYINTTYGIELEELKDPATGVSYLFHKDFYT